MSEEETRFDELLEEALTWEREHRPSSGWEPPEGLDDPLEQANDSEMPDDDMVTDLPYGPDDLGRDLSAMERAGKGASGSSPGTGSAALGRIGGKRETYRELPSGVNPHDLERTGWGLIVPRGMKEPYLDALMPLLEWRADQVGAFRVEIYDDQSPTAFLWQGLHSSPGVIDPKRLPYYLLIVGGPERIPFEVQYALSVNHAVGRIAFDEREEEDLEDYTRWAQAVVDAERNGVGLGRRAAILSVQDGGRATRTLATHLVNPLEERMADFMADWPAASAWEVDVRRGEAASKAGFGRVFGGEETPGLALVSAHGLYLDARNRHQKLFQGAFCCQSENGVPDSQKIFHIGDLADGRKGERSLHGLMAFLFCCYGAGTPELDGFPQHQGRKIVAELPPEPRRLAQQPFLAAMPQEMLRRGALAVVGHVDRGWTLSFAWTLAHRYTDAVRSLEDSLKQLLRGHRIGHAMRSVHRRYLALAAHLAEPLDRLRRGGTADFRQLGLQWTAHHDARNFILLGDPAAYLLGRRDPHRRFCCDLWTVSREGSRYQGPSGPALALSPGLHRYLEREARAHSMSPEVWLESILRQRGASEALHRRSPS